VKEDPRAKRGGAEVEINVVLQRETVEAVAYLGLIGDSTDVDWQWDATNWARGTVRGRGWTLAEGEYLLALLHEYAS